MSCKTRGVLLVWLAAFGGGGPLALAAEGFLEPDVEVLYRLSSGDPQTYFGWAFSELADSWCEGLRSPAATGGAGVCLLGEGWVIAL